MRILLQTPTADAGEWRDAIRAALPEATLTHWPARTAEVDYALVWRPPAELFAEVRVARAIFNLGAGVDALLAVPGLPREVPVVRLEDAGMAKPMAEYVTWAVLAAHRDAPAYAEQQRSAVWHPRPSTPEAEFGVGILGFGVLGRAVAAALAPFGFSLAGWSREHRDVHGVALFVGDAELPAFLARSRVLVCLLPSTPATRRLIDRRLLCLLPRGAHLVNVSRGDLIVEGDVLAALDDGRLAHSTLDVFSEEPLPAAHPFWHHPRITLTPHVSAPTIVADSVAQIAAKIRRLERGSAITGIVSRERGY